MREIVKVLQTRNGEQEVRLAGLEQEKSALQQQMDDELDDMADEMRVLQVANAKLKTELADDRLKAQTFSEQVTRKIAMAQEADRRAKMFQDENKYDVAIGSLECLCDTFLDLKLVSASMSERNLAPNDFMFGCST
jgi:regulator of replication initiation timing